MKQTWLRLYAEFAFDPKIQALHETLQRRYIMLLCLKCNEDIPGLTDEEIAFTLRIDVNELQKTKEIFIKKGFKGYQQNKNRENYREFQHLAFSNLTYQNRGLKIWECLSRPP